MRTLSAAHVGFRQRTCMLSSVPMLTTSMTWKSLPASTQGGIQGSLCRRWAHVPAAVFAHAQTAIVARRLSVYQSLYVIVCTCLWACFAAMQDTDNWDKTAEPCFNEVWSMHTYAEHLCHCAIGLDGMMCAYCAVCCRRAHAPAFPAVC